MWHLIRIRLIQLYRMLNGSVFFLLLTGLLVLSAFFVCYNFAEKTEESEILVALIVVLIYTIHVQRNDLNFVYHHLLKPFTAIVIEYTFYSLPVLAALLLQQKFIAAGIVISVLLLIPFYKPVKNTNTSLPHLSRLIPAKHFELLSGVRANWKWMLPLYLACIGLCWVRILPLLLLWFLIMTVTSWYTIYEPLHMLRAQGLNARKIILGKCLQHGGLLFMFQAPVVVLQVIFQPDLWWMALFYIPMLWCIIALSICLKYSTYSASETQSANNIIMSLVSLGVLLPFILPVPVLMLVVYYRKAVHNLTLYVYAQD
ncbi:MAG: hypothetical protein WC150_03650 [Bacteroidia bacterium]